MTESSHIAAQDLYRLVQDRAAALVRADVAFLERLLADEFQYVNSMGARLDRAAYLELYTSGKLVFDAQEVSDFDARFYGVTAVVTCLLDDRASYDGQAFEARFRTLQVYVRSTDGWRWVAGQTTEALSPGPS
jgi:hypothetical protein